MALEFMFQSFFILRTMSKIPNVKMLEWLVVFGGGVLQNVLNIAI